MSGGEVCRAGVPDFIRSIRLKQFPTLPIHSRSWACLGAQRLLVGYICSCIRHKRGNLANWTTEEGDKLAGIIRAQKVDRPRDMHCYIRSYMSHLHRFIIAFATALPSLYTYPHDYLSHIGITLSLYDISHKHAPNVSLPSSKFSQMFLPEISQSCGQQAWID